MLRLLLRLTIAIATVIACAGVARPERGSASLLASTVRVVAAAGASAERSGAPSESLHRWHEGAGHPLADLEAIEADDDDDDSLRDVLGVAALSFRCVPIPFEADRDPGGEVAVDTSRFAAGTGLPRGPPA